MSLTLASGGTTILGLTGGRGSLTVSSAGIAGSLSASVTTNALSSFFSLSTVAIGFSTTGGTAVSVEADGVAFTVASQSLTGDLAFGLGTDSSGNTVVTIAASNVTAALGSVGTVTGASGVLVVTSGSGLAASLTGNLALSVPGIAATGVFTVQINSSGTKVSQTYTVGGQTLALSLPAGTGPYVKVLATGATLTVLGQTLTADVTVVVTTGGTPSVSLALANGSLTIGGGLVSATGLTGSVSLSSNDASAALSGSLTIAAPGISVSAQTVSVSIDTATSAFSVVATGLTATIAGQTVSGDFTLSSGTDATGRPDVQVAFSNTTSTTPLLTLGPAGAPVVQVAHGTGQLLITSAGVAGSLTVSGVTFPNLPSSMSVGVGTFSLQINTLPSTVTLGTVVLPGGPYINLMVTNLMITVGGGSLQGSFTFSQQTAADGTSQTTIAATGVNATAGTGGTASLTGGEGAFVLTSGGIAGLLTGTAAAGDSSGGASISGSVILRVNTTPNAINETVPVGGQSVQIVFGPSEIGTSTSAFMALSVSSLTLTLGNFVSIQGTISYTNNAFAGTGLTVFLGQGPAYLASGALNPGATGILLTNAQIGLIKVPATNTYALNATGTATVLGVPGLTLGGTVTVQFNNTGAAQTITMPGSSNPPLTVNVPTGTSGGTYESASVTAGQLTVLGQSLQGTFSFAPVSGGVAITASAVAISLGGGTVSVTGGGGTLTLEQGSVAGSQGGVFGSLTATVTTSISGAQFAAGATFTLDVNTTATAQGALPAGPYVRVDASNVTLNLLSQSIMANVSIEATTLPTGLAVAIAATNVQVTLGTATHRRDRDRRLG